MEMYSIEIDGVGGFAVRVTTPDDTLGHTISFPMWRQARDWIAERTWTDHPEPGGGLRGPPAEG